MAILITTALPMLLYLALQAACIRHSCLSKPADEKRTAKFVNTETIGRSKAAHNLSIGKSKKTMHIKKDFKHSRTIERDGLAMPLSTLDAEEPFLCPGGSPYPVVSSLGKPCYCFGKMYIGNGSSFADESSWRELPTIYEGNKVHTMCRLPKVSVCDIHYSNRQDREACRILQRFVDTNEVQCWCDPRMFYTKILQRIDQPEYTLEKIVGAGQYGTVMKAVRDAQDGQELPQDVVVKFIPPRRLAGKVVYKASMDEYTAHFAARTMPKANSKRRHDDALVQNTWVPIMYEAFEYDENMILIQGYAPGDTLHSYVQYARSARGIYGIFWQLAQAVSGLHAEGIMHRDIKLSNINYERDSKYLALLDFGLAHNFTQGDVEAEGMQGTRHYLAPELLQTRAIHNEKVDIWSMGVVLYVLVFGKFPFHDEQNSNLDALIQENNPDYNLSSVEIQDFLDNPLQFASCVDLLIAMLNTDVDTRFSIGQVLGHEWMGDMSRDHNEYETIPPETRRPRFFNRR